jgi:O-6-methylguanine DNA methyltransferase
VHSLTIKTSHGRFSARYGEGGLAELYFPETAVIEDSSVPAIVQDWHALTTAAVIAILDGSVPSLLPPLELHMHTDFQRSVWHQLRQIPLGKTASYAEVGQRIGNPGATRAVGGACGANPIPLIIPCHRVLGANQTLGGFSGGLEWKRRLLAIEGITVKPAIVPLTCPT